MKATRNNQRGLSLPELMIGIGLTGVVAFAASQLLMTSTNTLKRQAHEQEVSMNMSRLSLTLRRVMATAVLLRNNNPGDPVPPIANGIGAYVVNHGQADQPGAYGAIQAGFDSSLSAEAAGTNRTDTIAAFLREKQQSVNPVVAGLTNRLEGIGIHWQFNTQTTSGAVYITRSNAFGLGGQVDPTQNDTFFDGLVDIQLDDVVVNERADEDDEVLKISFIVTARRWFGNVSGTRSWCSTTNIMASAAGCVNVVPYKDVERIIDVFFKNGVLGQSAFESPVAFNLYDRLYGPIYFLDFSTAQAF